MNERIRELEKQCWNNQTNHLDTEKFAELIIAECRSVALGEIVSDGDIEAYSDPLQREYLKGNNGGVVDSIVAIQQHFFGVEE
jgi:hypothetical protein